MDALLFGGLHSVRRKPHDKQTAWALYKAADNVMIRTLFYEKRYREVDIMCQAQNSQGFPEFSARDLCNVLALQPLMFFKGAPHYPFAKMR
jgi:hypothetical protein